jgi:hypothetical protein
MLEDGVPDCKARAMEIESHLMIGDGALGFCKAKRQIWATAKEQRRWVRDLHTALTTRLTPPHGPAPLNNL